MQPLAKKATLTFVHKFFLGLYIVFKMTDVFSDALNSSFWNNF